MNKTNLITIGWMISTPIIFFLGMIFGESITCHILEPQINELKRQAEVMNKELTEYEQAVSIYKQRVDNALSKR